MTFFKNVLQFPPHCPITTAMLKDVGISLSLQQKYKQSEWLKSIGHGAFLRSGDYATIEGAVYTLLKSNYNVHVGGKSALTIFHRNAHYLRNNESYDLFMETMDRKNLPKWFMSCFDNNYNFYRTNLFNTRVGIEEFNLADFSIRISTPERAFLELLYNCPATTSIQEAYEILELLPTLRPKILQTLLEECTSVKVKRVFMYLSSVANHDWYGALNRSKINLGTSVYKFSKNGKFNKEFNLVIQEVK